MASRRGGITMALNLNDATSNGNTLTNVNGIADVTTSLPFPTSTHAAGFTSASSQYFSAVQSSSLKPTGNFTLESWVKTSDSTVFFLVNYYENPNLAGFELFISGGKLLLQSGRDTGTTAGTDYQNITGSTTVNDGVWHHLAGVYDGTNLTIYVDGTQDGQVAWTHGAVYNASGNFRLGDRNYDGSEHNFATFTQDDVRMWNIARTAVEINGYKSVLLTGLEAGLTAYWPFEILPPRNSGFLSLL